MRWRAQAIAAVFWPCSPTLLTLLTRFYTVFAALDGDTMQACYAIDATFDDPVFTLRGHEQVGSMWRMLTTATKAKARADWKLDFSGFQADGATDSAFYWDAHYHFSAIRRLVHNLIDARFIFTDGHIATHRDRFDFWRWSRQALGPAGVLLN